MALATSKSTVTKDYKVLNVVIAGLPKIGKSTLASQLGDDVYFASTEPGLNFLEVFKTDVRKWQDFADLCKDIVGSKFKHLAIDVTDNLSDMAELEICERNKVKSVVDMPYGSGFTAFKRLMMNEFKKINDAGIGITFITHTKEKEYTTPEGITVSAIGTSLSASVEKQILGLSDLILFCYIDKAGARKMRTKPTKTIVCAGDRSGKLSEVMDMDAKALMEALKK